MQRISFSAGHLPFEGRNKEEIKHAISAGIMRPFPQGMSPACMSFVSAMMIRDVQQRPGAKQLLQHPIVLTYLRTLVPAQQPAAAPMVPTSDSASSLNGSTAMPRPLFAIKRPAQGVSASASWPLSIPAQRLEQVSCWPLCDCFLKWLRSSVLIPGAARLLRMSFIHGC